MRMKIFAAMLALSTILTPVSARADPFSLIGGAITALGLPGLGGAVTGLFGGFSAASFAAGFSAFSGLGGVLFATALQFGVNYLLAPKPKAEQIQGITRSPIPNRGLFFGRALVGGAMLFTSTKGNAIHYAVHHGDSECVNKIGYWFNDTPIATDGAGIVTTAPYSAFNIFKLEFHAGTVTQTVSPLLNAAFPEWDADHRGIGCCYTVLRGAEVSKEDRGDHYKYQGPMGLGEPMVLLEGEFERCYDPRNPTHDINDRSTWTWTDNAALVIAAFRVHPDGWNMPMSSVNWQKVGQAANICDPVITGRDGYAAKRYRIWTNAPFNEERQAVEKRMLEACDGMRFFDEEGRWYLRVGAYEEPTVTLTTKDIISIRIKPDADGENDADRFFVEYTDDRLLYRTTPSSPWVSPPRFVTDAAPQPQKIDIPECPGHRQAVELAKAIGARTRSETQMELVAGWRALRLREERFVRIAIGSAKEDGVFEIMGFEEAEDGMSIMLALVKTDPANWGLLPEEEGPLPTYENDVVSDTTVPALTGTPPITAQGAQVAIAGGFAVRLVASFTTPAIASNTVVVEFRKKTTTTWFRMTVVTADGTAYSDIVDDGSIYEYKAWVESPGGGKSTETAVYEVTAVADPTPPGDLTGVGISSPGAGLVNVAWTAPSGSANYFAARIFRGATNVFSAAAQVKIEPGLQGLADSWQDGAITPLPAGTYYYWIEPINGSYIAGTRNGPTSQVVA